VVGEDGVQFMGDADAFGDDLAVGFGLSAVLGCLGSLFGGDPFAPFPDKEAQRGGNDGPVEVEPVRSRV